MDLMKLAAELFTSQLKQEPNGASVSADSALGALKDLLPTSEGKLNAGELIGQLMSDGSAVGLVTSWLGDGENKALDPGVIANVLGNEQVSQFAEKLGIDPMVAMSALSKALPQLIDQGSSAGEIDASNVGGAVAGLAKGLMGGLFK